MSQRLFIHIFYNNMFTTLKYINAYNYYFLYKGTLCADEFMTRNAYEVIM